MNPSKFEFSREFYLILNGFPAHASNFISLFHFPFNESHRCFLFLLGDAQRIRNPLYMSIKMWSITAQQYSGSSPTSPIEGSSLIEDFYILQRDRWQCLNIALRVIARETRLWTMRKLGATENCSAVLFAPHLRIWEVLSIVSHIGPTDALKNASSSFKNFYSYRR